jgi:hypothetical protein
MQRRTAIKQFLILAGGAIVIPSCLNKEEGSSVTYKNIKITGEEEKILAEFGETLIPRGKTPGAKDTYAHLYALRMIDRCTEKEVQQSFKKGLANLSQRAEKELGTSFLKASPQQRLQLLKKLEAEKKGKDDTAVFYNTTKGHIMRGYLNSKPVMGDVFGYTLIPGPYNGAAPVKTITHPA